jgi:phosphotriesterase-related protein
MATVETIDGPRPVEGLGVTLMHEHIVTIDPEIDANYPGWWDESTGVPAAQQKLARLKSLGVDTIVDLTVLGLGRNVELVRRIVQPTGLNVIVATGIYVTDELPLFFRRRGPGTVNGGPEILEGLFTNDITTGIARTGIRAGILKCVTDERGLTPDVERALRATARVHRRTGVPISTHTHAPTCRGRDQQRLFKDEGVDLTRVIIGHCGDTTDLNYLIGLMEQGSYVGMDRFGMDNILSTRDRVATVVELVQRGYASRMLLSHDAHCHSLNWDPGVREKALPDWEHGFLFRSVLPALSQAGVSDAEIRQMVQVNPAEIFSRSGGY